MRQTQIDSSDIDLAVELSDAATSFSLIDPSRIQRKLAAALGAKVYLIEKAYLRQRVSHPRLPQADATNGLTIGRCIHLDTGTPIRSPMMDAQLQHLDLAINVYARYDRTLRLANTSPASTTTSGEACCRKTPTV